MHSPTDAIARGLSRDTGANNGQSASRADGGWVMLYVIMFVLLVSLMLIASLRIVGDLRGGARRAVVHSELVTETANVTRFLDAILRREIQAGNPDPFKAVTTAEANALLTTDPVGSASVYSISNLTLPGTPAWFSTLSFTQDNPRLALHGLASLWHVAYDLPAAFVLTRTTPSESTATSAVWRPVIWEVPTSQISLLALERLDLGSFEFPVTANGIALTPFGATETPFNVLTASSFVTPVPVPPSGMTATTTFVQPGLTLGWVGSPYDLFQSPSIPSPYGLQQLQERGCQLSWDGQTLQATGTIPAGVSIQAVDGEKRVVIDLALLPLTNGLIDSSGPTDPSNAISAYTVNCVGPQAMSRGVVVVGAGSQSRFRDAIITNGTVRLLGSHDSPILAATSYGAIVFDDPANASPSWRAYLHAPVPPARITSSTSPSANGTRQITGTAGNGSFVTSLTERSSNSLRFTASYPGVGPLQIGFTPATTASQPDLYLQVSPGVSTTVWAADKAGTAQLVDTIPWSGSGAVTVSLTYERGGHAVIATVGSVSSRTTLGATFQPRFETAGVLWSAPVTSLDLSVRNGGTKIYAAGAARTPILTGGLLIGAQLGGTLTSLTIQPDANIEALPLSVRMLYFNP